MTPRPLDPSNKDLKVSISGIRGIVGKSLTDKVVGEFARSFAFLVKGGRVLVAQDTRPSGRRFRQKIIRTLREYGCSVVDLGIAPTPTVLWMTLRLKARGGIMITASHNPAGWNGLKFIGGDGQFLDEKDVDRLLRIQAQDVFKGPSRRRGSLSSHPSAIRRYLHQILRHLNVQKIRRRRFRVVIDPCNGTGAVASPLFLRKLGCRLILLNGSPTGRFAHPPEPTKENLHQLSRSVRTSSADIGFAQDPDADRLAIVTEKGEPLSGEYTLALAVKWILSQRHTPVVVNLSTSRMIEAIAHASGAKVYYSKIGERHVVEKMQKVKAAIGGEGNGGVVYPKINSCRDSFVGMGLILEFLSRTGMSISQLVAELPHYEMIQKKLTLSRERVQALLQALRQHFKKGKINRLDGLRVDLKEGWIHARPSNTEPVLRLIAEAPTRKEALALLKKASRTSIRL